MPFINKSEATKRSKDRKIFGKCTNGTNRRSRVWPVCFIYISASSWTGFSCLTFSNLELKAWWTAVLNERGKLSSSFVDMLSWSVTICLAVKLFDVANQGHCYIVNSLRTWEYPIGDPVQFLNWFLAWKWGCVLLWPEVIFFSSALHASLTQLRRKVSIRKKYPLEPRVGSRLWDVCLIRRFEDLVEKIISPVVFDRSFKR